MAGMLLRLLCCVGALSAEAAHIESLNVSTSDGPREFLLAIPNQAATAPRPLVLLFHGHGGTAKNVLGQGFRPSPLAAWLDIADRDGVVVAALQGSTLGDGKPGWHDCRQRAPGNPGTDDVAFAAAVIADVSKRQTLDPQRFYAMGMSNGGMMVQRLALELAPPLAAVATASGTLAADNGCKPAQRPVPILLMHGTEDPVVPYAGGSVKILGHARGTTISVDDNVRFWLKADGLAELPVPVPQPFAHSGTGDTKASQQTWGNDNKAAQVSLIRVDGGGHVEPSLRYHYGPIYEKLVGRQNRDLEAAEQAWQFFRDKRTATP
jgi:polyhydroxybutyrate depolymerase